MELVSQILAIQSKKTEKVTFRGSDIAVNFNGKVIGTLSDASVILERERRSMPLFIGSRTEFDSTFGPIRETNQIMREGRQAGTNGLAPLAFWFDEFIDN